MTLVLLKGLHLELVAMLLQELRLKLRLLKSGWVACSWGHTGAAVTEGAAAEAAPLPQLLDDLHAKVFMFR